MVEAAPRTIPDRRTLGNATSAGRRPRRLSQRMGVVAAAALWALMLTVHAIAQEVNMWTTVTSLGAGTTTAVIKVDPIEPRPTSDRGLALPSVTVTNDGSQFRVSNLVLKLPD